MLKKILGAILATSMLFSTNVLAEEFSTQPMISSGSTWNLALKSDGTVWAWGLNEYGVIANGTVKYAQFPTQIKGLKDIVQVNAKSDFGMALDNTGKVWVWGKEYNNEEETDKSHKMDNSNAIFTSKDATPKVISDISDVKEIDGYGNTAIAVKKDGTVWSWDNSKINIGKKNIVAPKQVQGLSDVKSIAMGETYNNNDSYYAIALKNDGTVWDWGDSKNGYIQRVNKNKESEPQQILYLKDVTKIDAGEDVLLALDKDGAVWSWGDKENGKLGRDKAPLLMPQKIDGLNKIVDIKVGYDHSLALSSDGKVYGWGDNTEGELGKDGMTGRIEKSKTGNSSEIRFFAETPIEVPNVTNSVGIEAGHNFSMFITKDDSVLSCGENDYNQLARRKETTKNVVGKVKNSDKTEFNIGIAK
jgi:alpha-tubulin suppressor-like RCC1 family protein